MPRSRLYSKYPKCSFIRDGPLKLTIFHFDYVHIWEGFRKGPPIPKGRCNIKNVWNFVFKMGVKSPFILNRFFLKQNVQPKWKTVFYHVAISQIKIHIFLRSWTFGGFYITILFLKIIPLFFIPFIGIFQEKLLDKMNTIQLLEDQFQ